MVLRDGLHGELSELKLRLGISTWVYANSPVEKALSRLAGKGFRVFELWADQSQLDPRLFPKEGLDCLHESRESLGLIFHSLHTPFTGLDIASPDMSRREESIRWVLKAVEYAAELGCPFAVVHPGSGASTVVRDDASEVKDRLVDALRCIGEEAKFHGVRVLLENMSQGQGRRYGSRVSDLMETIEPLGRDEFGLCLDPGHTILSGLNVYEELRQADGLLLSLHVNDNDGLKDLHLVPLAPKTSVDWRRFLSVLKDIDYCGPFMLEVYGGDGSDEVVEAAKVLRERFPGLRL
jgi:sugar phosphate isomerase/epimerase